MLALAYAASSLFGMTALKPVFSALLTEQTDAAEVFSCVQDLWEGVKDVPANVFPEKVILSVPMTPSLTGTVTSGYGFREDPISGEMSFHTGVDIAAPQGTEIAAAYGGVVEQVGSSDVYGNFIVLRHGNFSTRYCHCRSILAQEGDNVRAGDRIALVGATGRVTGPHLHFELLIDGRAADPTAEMTDWIAL
jgi:murein DD-endopeptidase MepM/ murein hydrolase activator NlpD